MFTYLLNERDEMNDYNKFVIETYLNIRQAISETPSGDTPVWKALVGSLNLAQIALMEQGITHEEIEAVRV